MSRTKHHRDQKNTHCGHDFWSKRPCAGESYSSEGKIRTARIERRADVRLVQKEIQENFDGKSKRSR